MPAPAAAPPVSVARRRDRRPLIYAVLDQIFVVIFAYVMWAVIPNRHASAFVHLWSLPVFLQVAAIGSALSLVKSEGVRRVAWWLAIVGGSGLLAVTLLLIIRVLVSAAFLAGVYGAFGKAAATSALIGVALIVELVALLPLFQVKYLMSRAGRRAFSIPA
jgi:hypothetical protein